MTLYGYDPARIVLLRSRLLDAVEELGAIRSDDPAAAHAVRVVTLMRRNLEDSWLPLVDAIHTSTAMVAWRRSAGLVDDTTARVVSRLVEQFAAASAWIRSFGLDDVSDDRLADLLDETLGVVLDATDGRGSFGPALGRLDRVLHEIGQRTSAADELGIPTPAARFAGRHGTSGTERLIEVIDRVGSIEAMGLVGDDTVTTVAARVGPSLAALLGDLVSHLPEAADAMIDRAPRSDHLVRLVLGAPGAFDLAVITELARAIIHHIVGVGEWRDRPRVVSDASRADALLELLARAPGAASELLADPVTLSALATSRRFGPEQVEAVFAAALGPGTGDGASAALARLETLASVVAVATGAPITPGAARGLARSLGPVLPLLAVHLDRRLPVVVTVPGDDAPDGHRTVDLGTHAEVAALFGQLLDDHAAQITLGVLVGSHRAEVAVAAIDSIRERPGLTPADAMGHVAARLADVTRVIELLVVGRAAQDELHAFRHAMDQARSRRLLALLNTTLSTVLAPAVPLAGRISSITTSALTAVIDAGRPSTVPTTGIEADLAMQFTTTAIALAVADPGVRASLGLRRVPTATWNQLTGLLEALHDQADPEERRRLHSRLEHVVASDDDLDAYLENVRALSGEDRQG